MKTHSMILRALAILLLIFGFSLVHTTAFGDFLRLNPPADADKPFPVPAGDFSCWLATAANMLAAAGYGQGNTLQARADNIYYDDLIPHFTTKYPGWPDVAIDWWLNHSGRNVWPGNPYDKCDPCRDKNAGPWLDPDAPKKIGNWLREWNYVGLVIEVLIPSGSPCDQFNGNGVVPNGSVVPDVNVVPDGQVVHDGQVIPDGQVILNGPVNTLCNFLMSHAVTAWGDELGESELTNNPTQVWVTDSDRDYLGDVQEYNYLFDEQVGWRLDYTDAYPPLRNALILRPNDKVTDAKDTVLVVGSYNIHQGYSNHEATDLHYRVGTDTAICSYRTTIDWPRPNNPSPPIIVEDASPPWHLDVEWDFNEDPVPYCNSVTITTEFVLSLRNDIEYEDVHWTFSDGQTWSMPGFRWFISTPQYVDPNAVIANITGGYVIGSFDIIEVITEEDDVQIPQRIGQYRFQHEYLYYQDPEHHNFDLIPSQVPFQNRTYYIANLRFGHTYGLLDDDSLWAFDNWMSEYPMNREFTPGTSIEIDLNWEGLLPYPELMRPASIRAYDPNPANGAIHEDTWVALTWLPGEYVVSHDVYLGENFDDVNDGISGTFQGNQSSTFFVAGFPGFAYPDGLVLGTTYYWRVDEVNNIDPNKPCKGNVWSFTVPPRTAYNPVPPDGAGFVDPNLMLTWMAGFNAKLHTVYFGDNFDIVSNAVGGLSQVTTTYNPGPLELGKTYYWRIDEFDGLVMHRGDVWSFINLPDMPFIDPDIVGWWKFDEGGGTTVLDWSGHDNHGTLVNGARWAPSYDGGALELDGVDDYMVIPYTTDPQTYTITAWVKPARASSVNIIVRTSSSGPTVNWSHQLRINSSGLFEHYVWDGSERKVTGTSKVTGNTWYFVAGLAANDGRMRLYVNGQEEGASTNIGTMWTGGDRFLVGSDSGNGMSWFKGLIDDLCIYNYND